MASMCQMGLADFDVEALSNAQADIYNGLGTNFVNGFEDLVTLVRKNEVPRVMELGEGCRNLNEALCWL